MAEKDVISMSNPTMQRLPQYLREIKRLRNLGDQNVSCTKLSEIIGILPITVRKDLQQAGVIGRPKTGYVLDEMIAQLESTLGLDNNRDVVLIGAGNLGCALLGYRGFAACGVDIVAAFDVDKEKVGKEFHEKKILPMSKLESLVKRLHIKIAILTTPPEVAQEIVNRLTAAGIQAVWNFSSAAIKAPANVVIQNEHLTVSLSVLLLKVNQMQSEELKFTPEEKNKR